MIVNSKGKLAEKALRMEKETAEATARTKSQFLANMSHELRTPMTGILGMLELALEEEIAPVPRRYLETSLRSARSLLRTLNDILDMSKIEEGKLHFEAKPFSLKNCISEAVNIITPELHRKRLDFVISGAQQVPDAVLGDQDRLRQVLINLIGNAVKFTSRGKVVLRLSTGNTTSNEKREFTFSVSDTGTGIPLDKKGLIFQAFSQVDASDSRRFGGTGLGLAISKEIVELMGGTITFESEEGLGSTFTFTIPLSEATLKSEARFLAKLRTTEAAAPATAGPGNRRLLLAEDDAITRQVLGVMFKRANYQVDFAQDGLEAVEMWEKGTYDLVLMDIQMPRSNGFEAARAIREKERDLNCHIPIVAMSAHAAKEGCHAAGMDAYISKPIDFDKILKVIGKIFSQQTSCAY